MKYSLNFLRENQLPEIYQCMLDAFSDYSIDMSYMTFERFKNRMIKNGVKYDCSPAVFVEGKIVGFTLIGIDYWNNVLSGFDAITGIVKKHRGNRLARRMFEFSTERLTVLGVKKFVLEVLQDNTPAVKAYEKTGFKINREFILYKLNFSDHLKKQFNTIDLEIKPILYSELKTTKSFADWQPSWENSYSSIKRIPDKVIISGAYSKDQLIGSITYYPELNWILNLTVHRDFRQKGIANRLIESLFLNLDPNQESFKLNNVLKEDYAFAKLMIANGFHEYGSQYEMVMNIS